MYIVETKTEYTTQLVNILTPYLYEGIFTIYEDSLKVSKDKDELKNFQTLLRKVPNWNQHIILEETNRIVSKSNKGTLIDDLIKAVIKSNIMILTNTTPENKNKLKIKHNITTDYFIHYCYIEIARNIFNNPYLLCQKYGPYELKKNQRDTIELIKNCIKESIRKLLPLDLILKEYIGESFQETNTDFDNPISESDTDKVKKMLSKEKPKDEKFSLIKNTDTNTNDKKLFTKNIDTLNLKITSNNNKKNDNVIIEENEINSDKHEEKININLEKNKTNINSDKEKNKTNINSDKEKNKTNINSDKEKNKQNSNSDKEIKLEKEIKNSIIVTVNNDNQLGGKNEKLDTEASEYYYIQAKKSGICENYSNTVVKDNTFTKDNVFANGNTLVKNNDIFIPNLMSLNNSIMMSSQRKDIDIVKDKKQVNLLKNNYFKESKINF
jgi:hypothetical protein